MCYNRFVGSREGGLSVTKEQALKELEECITMEPETAHSWADHVLCELLKAQGYNEVVEAWNRITPKWYS